MKNYILQIDTATEVCSVAVSQNGQVLAHVEANEPNIHASKLTIYIEEMMQSVGVEFSDLCAIAVSMGPGSYTGLRIGVSTAKGLCYALDIPLIGINTLESIFEGYASQNTLQTSSVYIPMLDARRMEVYMSAFDSKKKIIQETQAVIVEKDTFDVFKPSQVVLIGSGAAKLKDLFRDSEQVHLDASYKHSAAYLSGKAFERFEQNKFEDLICFEPYYLKEFIATTNKKPILG